jgi:hypothetical protein
MAGCCIMNTAKSLPWSPWKHSADSSSMAFESHVVGWCEKMREFLVFLRGNRSVEFYGSNVHPTRHKTEIRLHSSSPGQEAAVKIIIDTQHYYLKPDFEIENPLPILTTSTTLSYVVVPQHVESTCDSEVGVWTPLKRGPLAITLAPKLNR